MLSLEPLFGVEAARCRLNPHHIYLADFRSHTAPLASTREVRLSWRFGIPHPGCRNMGCADSLQKRRLNPIARISVLLPARSHSMSTISSLNPMISPHTRNCSTITRLIHPGKPQHSRMLNTSLV